MFDSLLYNTVTGGQRIRLDCSEYWEVLADVPPSDNIEEIMQWVFGDDNTSECEDEENSDSEC